MQGTVAILRPFGTTVSYYPEIANHCFLSYTLKIRKSFQLLKLQKQLVVTYMSQYSYQCRQGYSQVCFLLVSYKF